MSNSFFCLTVLRWVAQVSGSFRSLSILLFCPHSEHCPHVRGRHCGHRRPFLVCFSISYASCSVSGRPETCCPTYRLEETWKTKQLSATLIHTSGKAARCVLGVRGRKGSMRFDCCIAVMLMWWWYSSAIWPVRSRLYIVVRKKVYSKEGKDTEGWTEEMTYWQRVCTTQAEDPTWFPSITLRGSQPLVSSFGISWCLIPLAPAGTFT